MKTATEIQKMKNTRALANIIKGIEITEGTSCTKSQAHLKTAIAILILWNKHINIISDIADKQSKDIPNILI